MPDYAPKGVSYTGMVTGIVGAAGAVGNAITEMMQARNNGQNRDPADKPVTRYELGLIQENIAKDVKIAALEGRQYTDAKIGEVKDFQAQQLAHNAMSDTMTRAIQGQVAQLYGMTQLMIQPNRIIPPMPLPTETPPTVSSGASTPTTNTGT